MIQLNSNCLQIPDHHNKKLIIRGCGSGKTNSLFNLINHQPDINKIYLYPKHQSEGKYQLLINKPKRKDLNHFNDSEAFIEYSNYQIHVLIMLFIWGSKLNISLVFITVLFCCT